MSTAQPFSSLKNVTRSISPERLSLGRCDSCSVRNGNERLWLHRLRLARSVGSGYAAVMPENEPRVIDTATGLGTVLTAREKRDLEKAERKIATGLRFFVEVGTALKEIRDNRLYRQDYRTFEEYVVARWDFSRPRAYELCAASEVMADLSGIPDIRVLPENEAQANPLTRLKTATHRKRAWRMALRSASKKGRPVTARDAEEAVSLLS